MQGLGSLIKALRKERKLSVSKFCSGTCTARYVYMIENNQKIPSSTILEEFNRRLGLNILSYYDYTSFSKPIISKYYADLSRNIRYKRDYSKLKDTIIAMEGMPDRGKQPFADELFCNKMLFMIFVDGDFAKAELEIDSRIKALTGKSIGELISESTLVTEFVSLVLINYVYVVKSRQNNQTEADNIIRYLKDCFNSIQGLDRNYSVLYVSVIINYFHSKVILKKSKEHLEELISFMTYQTDSNVLDRIYFTYYFISYCFYNINDNAKAKEFFAKCVLAGKGVGIEMQFNELIKSMDTDYLATVCPDKKLIIDDLY